MARVLILGQTGQVAAALLARLPQDGHEVEALGRAGSDLGDPASARASVLDRRPDIVVNAAAYTAVDRAETDEAAARALNAEGPAAAAAAAAEIGAAFIHFSTDYVFDGSKGQPYEEIDAPNPLGVYGRTKLEGELAIAAANPRHILLRTSWVCSPGGSNFVRTMLRLAVERESLGVVDDQYGRPTFAQDLADAVAVIIARLPEHLASDGWGVFHVAGQGETTWCGFARAIMEGSRSRGGPAAEIRPITTADFPTPTRRPVDSRLSTERLASVYDVRLPPWQASLDVCLDEIYGLTRAGATR